MHIKSYKDEKIQKILVESIQHAFTKKDIGSEYDTNNGESGTRWDICNTKVIRTLANVANVANVETHIIDRQIWKCVMVYFTDTRQALLIVKNERMKELVKEKISHYVKILARPNRKYDELVIGSQRTFDEYDDLETAPTEAELDMMGKDILKQYDGKIDELSLLTFEAKNYNLLSVNHIIPSSMLDIVFETDWSKHIDSEYHDIGDITNVDYEDGSVDEQVVREIKPKVEIKLK